ncbi:cilia- and flagella-associated protein 107-like [Saccostrea echinata]|uniref:cilia- and flagella-associated protein 107-like n=1 Tax=Saccostrea echinata TaxID=191078 RepID=UPI002A82C7A1|nr:cilia- and flagella-associated protein 107-like [Saccostrea echinata]
MAQGDPMKWHMPGWRIEQRFSPGVLIGNWGEERYTFKKGDTKHNSTHRVDFRNYGTYKPDVIVRRKALMRNDGLGQEHIFHHHGDKYMQNKISWYDEQYNGRYKENTLPSLRDWNSHKLSWAPEKSDYPLQGKPTNFGLHEQLQSKWKDQIADEVKGDYLSTYQNSYVGPPRENLVRNRFAISKDMSTTLHPYNKVNKDLHLRNTVAFKSPEKLPDLVYT